MPTSSRWKLDAGPQELQTVPLRFENPTVGAQREMDEDALAKEREELLSTPEWSLACRVAASKGLNKSELLPRFLLHVCAESLLGRESEITEQRIGIRIFNRPSGYNPGEDNIVRSYARMLRKRLDAYFEGEGSNESIRIVIPRGAYVPVFQDGPKRREPVSMIGQQVNAVQDELWTSDPSAPTMLQVGDDPTIAKDETRRFAWPSALGGLVIGTLLASAGWLGFHVVQARRAQGPAHALWAQIFQQNRNTLIVPSDSGVGILQNLSRHEINVEEYANGSYLSEISSPPGLDQKNFNDLSQQRYTSVVALNITLALAQLPEFIASRTQIRYARNVTAEDIKHANVILLGSKHTNPWVSLFEKKLNFKLVYTPQVDESYVLNEHPFGAEQKMYRNGAGAPDNHTYGVVAYLPSLDGAGHVLIIQGLNMAATQAAADTLFNGDVIQPILQQATLPNGALRPFELLVETTSVGATAPGVQLIATRIYPQ